MCTFAGYLRRFLDYGCTSIEIALLKPCTMLAHLLWIWFLENCFRSHGTWWKNYNNRIRNSVKLVYFVGITHTSICSIKKHWNSQNEIRVLLQKKHTLSNWLNKNMSNKTQCLMLLINLVIKQCKWCRLTQTGKSSFSCWFAFFHFAVMALKKCPLHNPFFVKQRAWNRFNNFCFLRCLKKWNLF